MGVDRLVAARRALPRAGGDAVRRIVLALALALPAVLAITTNDGSLFGLTGGAPHLAVPAKHQADDQTLESDEATSLPGADGAPGPWSRVVSPGSLSRSGTRTVTDDDGFVDTTPVVGPSTSATGGWVRPAPGPYTSPFGMRFHPVLLVWKLHDGLDIGASCGTPVRATKAGTVVAASEVTGYGLRIILDHGQYNGSHLETMYAHLSSVGVRPGQTVAQGEVIAMSGNTGFSTGCHLHFMTIVNGTPVDPATIVIFDGNPPPAGKPYVPVLTATASASTTPSATPTPTPSASATPTPTPSATPTPTPSQSATPTPSASTPGQSATPSKTPSSATSSASPAAPVSSRSASRSASPVASSTP